VNRPFSAFVSVESGSIAVFETGPEANPHLAAGQIFFQHAGIARTFLT
jgi:hypothetical protein